ncbi:hypothetical protein [Fulvitalea axinellae]
MKSIFYTLLLSICCTWACTSNSKKENSAEKETPKATASVTVYSVDSLAAGIDKLVGQEITVKGNVQHVCKHSGKKAFLVGDNPDTKIQVKVGGKIKSFGGELIGEELTLKGKVMETRIDEAYLARWEEELKKEEAKHDHKHDKKEAGKKADEASCDAGNSPVDKLRAEIKASGKEYKSVYFLQGMEYSISDGE